MTGPFRPDPHASSSADREFASEVARILDAHLVSRTFKAGQLLWREGDENGKLVALVDGRVKIYRLLPNGEAATAFIFGPGDVFGFMPFFDDAPYPAFAQAIGVVKARVAERADLHEALRKEPDLAILLLKLLSRRLREAFDHIEVISARGVLYKAARALASLMPEARVAGGATILTLPVSSAEFANLFGLTPESFSRGITQLVESGVIHRLRVNSFQVRDPDELLHLASASGSARI